ncbi:MAG: inositol monophosphatase [Acidobacteriia bacterium]|nr:inositol monophosphatase [Methyloceanibacter sp.]MBX5471992.1 inositol monophosphatase [Acetobacteraceae bacterium]MCL6491254.1 inositol monophosphatase [Terriglobia bacterium]
MNFGERELAEFAAILRHAAAAEIMPRFQRLRLEQVRRKSGPLDLVTDADEAAEAAITEALARRFPEAVIIGEEASARTPDWLERLTSARLAFVIDPLDGTANFAAGLPLFACMGAVLWEGEVVGAAIHDPVGLSTALARKGAGAWLEDREGNRRRLAVAEPVPARRMTGTVSWRFLPETQRQLVCRNLPRVAACWDYRCAGHEYRLLAGGHCHFVIFNRLMPWDHAPGWLLHREAGGFSAQFDGGPYRPHVTTGGLICAPDEASWQALHQALLQP